MTRAALRLVDIRLDESTQVRVAIDHAVVADYAEQMQAGAEFPPIVVFTDGTTYRLADGYHRYLAAARNEWMTLTADVHPGTQSDALWFALGANRTNGQRLSEGDKTRAVTLALAMWPTRVQREIADQVGCSTSLVSKVAQDVVKNTGGAPALRGQALVAQTKREATRAMVQAGHQSIAIREALHVHPSVIAEVRRELGLTTIDYSRSAVKARRAQLREMAAAGHTSLQIADALGMSVEGCRTLLRRAGITVPGDVVTRGLHHHDSNRIMARIVADADDLTAGANYIDFHALDRAQFADWIDTLRQARATISTFMKRLMQEQAHAEVAESQAVQDSPGADLADARPARVGGAAGLSSGPRQCDRGEHGSQQTGVPDRQSA